MNPKVFDERLAAVVGKAFPVEWQNLPPLGVVGGDRDLPQPSDLVRSYEEPAEVKAVYALVDAGIRVVVAESFADIFSGNAVNNGLLPVATPEAAALRAAIGQGAAPARVDLASRRLSVAGQELNFALSETAQAKLMNGWDDIDLTRAHAGDIRNFRDRRKADHAWAWPSA